MSVTSENIIVRPPPLHPNPKIRSANASDLSQTSSNAATEAEVLNQLITGTSSQSLSSTIHVVLEFQPKSLQVVFLILPLNLHPTQTRSKSGISKKNAFLAMSYDNAKVDLSQIKPVSYKSALKSLVWFKAMEEEIQVLNSQNS